VEWAALLVPIVCGLVLHYCFPHKFVWWEILLPMLPVFIIIPGVKLAADKVLTHDTERHCGCAIQARYYEDWNEYIHQTCTRTVGTGKNARTEVYDCSYVDYHSPKWQVEDSNGYVVDISQDDYTRLVSKFGGEKFVDMHRRYYTNDGDAYVADWNNLDDTLQPVTTLHSYENRVQAASGVLAFPVVDDPKATGLFDYPALPDCLNDRAVLGTAAGVDVANSKLMKWNAKLGRKKEVRFWLLLFRDKPRSVGFDQESYWKGGNKNEFVVCVGVDSSNRVEWCHPFCWSPDGNATNDELKIEVRDLFEYQKSLNLPSAVDQMVELAKVKFVRKNFEEFAYLDVEIPTGWIVLIWVLTVLSTAGTCWFAIANEIDEENTLTDFLNRRSRGYR
jgi:hypothetical protein